MESDADRLAMLQALGGTQVQAQGATFTALFDAAYQAALSDPAIEGVHPALTCRTADVERLALTKGLPLTVGGVAYRILRHEPDGTGMSLLVLKR